MNKYLLAVLNLAIAQAPTGLPSGYFLIFPEGDNICTGDGRPEDAAGWVMLPQNGNKLADALNQSPKDMVIDYEHQTILSKSNGQPAPAAGWLKAGKFVYVDGVGLCSSEYSYTKKAADYIAAEEYRYKSPVILYEEKTGVVTGLHSIAITNDPALNMLDELSPAALAALSAQLNLDAAFFNNPTQSTTTGDTTMNKELLALLCRMLGLAADASQEEIQTALTAQTQALSTATGVEFGKDNTTLATLATKYTEREAQHTAALTAAKDEQTPDPAQYVPIAVLTAMQTQLATMAGNQKSEADELITAALSDGRLLDAQKEWATQYAKQDLAGFKAYLSNTPKIAALTQKQTTTVTDVPTGQAQLSADVADVAKQMGLDAKELAQSMSNQE